MAVLKDAMFCYPCLFAQQSITSGKWHYSKEWTEVGVTNWKDALNKIGKHEKSEAHTLCCERLHHYKSGVRIDQILDDERSCLATERQAKIETS